MVNGNTDRMHSTTDAIREYRGFMLKVEQM